MAQGLVNFSDAFVRTTGVSDQTIRIYNLGLNGTPNDRFWAEFEWDEGSLSWRFNGSFGRQDTLLAGHNPEFDERALVNEGYWYSRYNLGELVMTSGLGVTFAPDMAQVMAAIPMFDPDPNDGDAAAPPTNPALLRAVYKSGNPVWVNENNGNSADFTNFRWDASSFDTTVTVEAQAYTIIKEIEWARLFHFEPHFGAPTATFGAQQRFIGMVLAMEAAMQAMEWMNWRTGAAGATPFVTSKIGAYVMLQALSDLADLKSRDALDGSDTNRYRDAQMGAMFGSAADSLFAEIAAGEPPSTVIEQAVAATGLAWYAAYTSNNANRASALAKIAEFGDALIAAEKATVRSKAYAVRGLIEAARTSAEPRFLTAAAEVFNSLVAEYDWTHGYFTSQPVYHVDDVAAILGALNALNQLGGDAVNQTTVKALWLNFFESAVNLSGLKRSAPPSSSIGAFERLRDIDHRYPTLPLPPMAGGKNGVAPVFATEITINPVTKTWMVTNTYFDSAGAMHLSNEMLWSHTFYLKAFPNIPGVSDTEPVAEPAPVAEPTPEASPVVETPPPVPTVSFSADVQPIFTANCALAGCHSGPRAILNQNLSAGLAFSNIVGVRSVEVNTLNRIQPGDPDNSYLIQKVRGVAAVGERMPFGRPSLADEAIATIIAWAAAGAPNN